MSRTIATVKNIDAVVPVIFHMALEPRVAVVRHIAISTAVVPTVIMTKITLAAVIAAVIAVVLVIAVTVIVVPCWNDHAASERDGEDRKNEDVSHVGLSVENNSMKQWLRKEVSEEHSHPVI